VEGVRGVLESIWELSSHNGNPDKLPKETKQLLTAVSVFMQRGGYHTPAEVAGGLLVAAASILGMKEKDNASEMTVRYEKILGVMNDHPEQVFIVDGEMRASFSAKMSGKVEELERVMRDSVSGQSPPPSTPQATTATTATTERRLLPDEAQRMIEARESRETPDNRERRRAQLSKIASEVEQFPQVLGYDEMIARDRANQEASATLLAYNSERLRQNLSMASDALEFGKYVEGTASTLVDAHVLGDGLEAVGRIHESLALLNAIIGIGRYSMAIHKNRQLEPGLLGALNQTDIFLRRFDDAGKALQGLQENREQKKQQLAEIKTRLTAGSALPDQDKVSLTEDKTGIETEIGRLDKTIARLEQVYSLLSAKVPELRNKAATLRYKLFEGDIKMYVRYPAGIMTGTGSTVKTVGDILDLSSKTVAGMTVGALGVAFSPVSAVSTVFSGVRTYQASRNAYKANQRINSIDQQIKEIRDRAAEMIRQEAGERAVKQIKGEMSNGELFTQIRNLSEELTDGFFNQVLDQLPGDERSSFTVDRFFQVIENNSELKARLEPLRELVAIQKHAREGVTPEEPSKGEVDLKIKSTPELRSIYRLLEISKNRIESDLKDHRLNAAGEGLAAAAGVLSLIGNAMTIAGLAGAPVTFGATLAISLVGIAITLTSAGMLVGIALWKRSRDRARQDRLHDAQTGLADLMKGVSLDELMAKNPFVNKTSSRIREQALTNISLRGSATPLEEKIIGDKEYLRKLVIAECKQYIRSHHVNQSAAATYSALEGELEDMAQLLRSAHADKTKGVRITPEQEVLLEKLVTERRGALPPPDLTNPDAQKEYFSLVKRLKGDGPFQKDYPVMQALVNLRRVDSQVNGEIAIANIYYSGPRGGGSRADSISALLVTLGVAPLAVGEQLAGDFYREPDTGISSLAATTGVRSSAAETGITGVVQLLRKYSAIRPESDSLIKGLPPVGEALTGSKLRQAVDQLREITDPQATDPSHARRTDPSPTRILESLLTRNNQRDLLMVLGSSDFRALDHSRFGRFVQGLSDRGEPLSRVVKKRFEDSPTLLDSLRGAAPPPQFFVSLEQGTNEKDRRQFRETVNPGLRIELDVNHQAKPEILLCNQSEYGSRPSYVVYDRVGSQWFLSNASGRVPVDLNPEIIEANITSLATSYETKLLYIQIRKDLRENCSLIGYEIQKKVFERSESPAPPIANSERGTHNLAQTTPIERPAPNTADPLVKVDVGPDLTSISKVGGGLDSTNAEKTTPPEENRAKFLINPDAKTTFV